MMLMTKFGKFKLRLIATINLSALLTIFNLASATSNYWIKYTDVESTGGGQQQHVAGLWRSCPSGQQTNDGCVWKNGILTHSHSIWSVCVRLLIFAGTVGNVAAVTCLCLAFYFKVNKRSKCAIKFMECANFILIGSLIGTLCGFCVLLSTQCNFSMCLHVVAMCLVAATSNLVTRTFARLYYVNTRGGKGASRSAGVEAGCCTVDEKIALAQVADKETNTNGVIVATAAEVQMSPVEVSSKVSEKHGSNEALLPAQQTASAQPNADTAATTTTN